MKSDGDINLNKALTTLYRLHDKLKTKTYRGYMFVF